MNDETNQGILKPGEVLNNTYVIAEMVASGGTGEVYRATNRVSGREIAIKILKREFAQNEQFANLMKREASVLHELITEGVVRYYDLLESDLHGGFLFIVMEFIHGDSLNVNMKRGIPMAADVVIKVAHRVLLGLHAAHTQKLFHRDLSPDNIILKDNDASKATLIDFGIAKDVNEGAKTIIGGGFAGKYQYAAPEQMEGTTDARSDLYSLGVTLLGAFRGRTPGEGATLVEILDAKVDKPDISGLPEPLYGLISKMVEPEPANRFQSAEEALLFLEASGAALSTAVPFTTTPPLSVPPTPIPAPDQTVIVQPRAVARPAEKPVEKKSRTGLLITLILLLVLSAAAGAWYTGLLGPATAPVTVKDPGPESDENVKVVKQLPVASPFVLTVARTSKADPITLRGNLPSAESIPEFTKLLEEGLDTFAVLSAVTPAQGQPFEGWARKIVEIALKFNQLDEWSVAASNRTITLTGATQNAAEKSALLGAASSVMSGLGVTFVDQLTVTVAPVLLSEVRTALSFIRSCGALVATGGKNGTVAARDTISVAGLVAKSSDVSRVQTLLAEAAPDRPQNLNLQIVNPGVCSIIQVLPDAKSKLLKVDYSYGTSTRTVQRDTYKLGENPVIDIELDAATKGFLSVIYVDFGDQVFHLLPHQARTENNLQKIGKVANGKRIIRAAFPISEATVARLGFKVVEPVGSNMIVVIVTPQPLFAELRPRAESNAAFVEAARDKLRRLNGITGFATYRPLITKP